MIDDWGGVHSEDPLFQYSMIASRKGRIEKAVLHELNGLKYALVGAIDTKSMKGEQP